MSDITDIYQSMNDNVESFFNYLQTNPKLGLLFIAALLALWLTGLLLKWKWACHWQFNSKLWFLDDCSPETRRLIQIVLISVAFIGCLMMFFAWK